MGRPPLSDEQRERGFWARVRLTPGCWYWTGYVTKKGYGTCWWAGRTRGAHVVAWMLANGRWPHDGLEVDHLCDQPDCVRPSHLEEKPGVANNARSSSPSALNAVKTACPQGHQYKATTTQRWCPTCSRERKRALRSA